MGECFVKPLLAPSLLPSYQSKKIMELSPQPRIGQNILPQEGIAELLGKDVDTGMGEALWGQEYNGSSTMALFSTRSRVHSSWADLSPMG